MLGGTDSADRYGYQYINGSYVGDTFNGGTGNDIINGGYYANTYEFNLGDGADIIREYGYSGTDRIVFGAGIAVADITSTRVGVDLVLSHSNGADSIIIEKWFSGDQYHVEEVIFSDGTVWDSATLLAQGLELVGTAGNDTLTGVNAYGDNIQGLAGDDTLNGGGGNDTLDGGTGNDVLNGGAGADILSGGAGDDVLGGTDSADRYGYQYINGSYVGDTFNGGTGNDIINGGYYANTYEFNLGDGADIIREYGYSGTDRIVFGAGIAVADITSTRVGVDLVLSHSNGADSIIIEKWFSGDQYHVEEVIFSDGTVWDSATLLAQGLELVGTADNDTLTGVTAYGDHIQGLAGDDTLNGSGGNDVLEGGIGNDVLNGGAGVDTLYGGAGDDVLGGTDSADRYGYQYINGSYVGDTFNGGTGNDIINGGYYANTYEFNLGDGADIIREYGASSFNDKLVFGENISYDQLWFKQVGNDLQVSIIGTDSLVNIEDWYLSSNNEIEEIHVSSGEVLYESQVAQLVAAMASFSPPLQGETTLSTELASQLDPVIAASWQA